LECDEKLPPAIKIYIEAKKRFSPKPKSATTSSSNQSSNLKHSYANVARAGAAGNFDNNQFNGQSPLADLEERMMRRMESMMNTMFNQFQNLMMSMLSSQNNSHSITPSL